MKNGQFGTPLLGDVVPEGFFRSTRNVTGARDEHLKLHQTMGRAVVVRNAEINDAAAPWAKQPKEKL